MPGQYPEKFKIPFTVRVLDLDMDPPQEKTIEFESAKDFKPERCPGLATVGGVMVDEILKEGTPCFAVRLADGSVLTATGVISSMKFYEPLEDELLRKGMIKLPGEPADYGSELELRGQILDLINRYVDISEPYPELCCDYAIQTWLYDRTRAQLTLNPRGPVESGKSRLREVMLELCYRGMNLGGAMTTAGLFRSAEIWKGTLCIDEGDFPPGSEDVSLVKVLNMRYQHDGAILRVDRDTLKLRGFRVFGPTVLCSRRGFGDDALESRCVVVPMEETEREEIPLTLPQEFYGEAREIRCKLLAFRFNRWHGFRVDDSIRYPGVGKRLNQMLQPMASLARSVSPDLYSKIEGMAKQLFERQIEERAYSRDGFIIRSYLDLAREGKEAITPTDLMERIDAHFRDHMEPEVIGRRLTPLGFKRRKTTGGLRVINLEGKHLRRALKRYVPGDERAVWDVFEFKRGRVAELKEKTIVRMIKDQPKIVTSEGKPAGPFERGKLYSLPPKDARLFVARGVAREAEWQ